MKAYSTHAMSSLSTPFYLMPTVASQWESIIEIIRIILNAKKAEDPNILKRDQLRGSFKNVEHQYRGVSNI